MGLWTVLTKLRDKLGGEKGQSPNGRTDEQSDSAAAPGAQDPTPVASADAAAAGFPSELR
jgi:hypothetical protein